MHAPEYVSERWILLISLHGVEVVDVVETCVEGRCLMGVGYMKGVSVA